MKKKSLPNILVLSGRMGSGKDYVAQQGGYRILGVADPIYQIAEWYLGSSDKSQPCVRSFLQNIGAWGRGMEVSWDANGAGKEYFTGLITTWWKEMVAPEFHFVDAQRFGQPTFWIDTLVERLNRLKGRQRVAITNARFESEVDAFCKAGGQHWHVRCSSATRKERLGTGYSAQAEADVTEKLAARLDEFMPDERVIWNDHRLMPKNKRYWTVSSLLVDEGWDERHPVGREQLESALGRAA